MTIVLVNLIVFIYQLGMRYDRHAVALTARNPQ
jgi:hypothetical protein